MATTLRQISLTCALAAVATVGVHTQTPARQPTSPALQSLVGRDSFDGFCASCHGVSGRGDGTLAASLKVKPADLTGLAHRHAGVFPRDQVVAYIDGTGRALPAHGTTEMPLWGGIFRWLDSEPRTRVRLDNIVAYIESLQAAPAAAVGPELNGAELFGNFCAACHGPAGRGDGAFKGQLLRDPPDLTRYRIRTRGGFPTDRLRRIIDGRDIDAHGNRSMPVWGDIFKRVDGTGSDAVGRRIQALIDFILSIQEQFAE